MNSATAQTLFLELLKAAIWDRPANASMFQDLSPQTWKDISDVAAQQSVDALIADKVISLPTACLPTPAQIAYFMTRMEQVQDRNLELDAALVKIAKAYEAQSLSFLLLKGHTNSINYPKPALRTLGDIDIYLYRKGDYEKANEWAQQQGYRFDAENIHHQSFDFDNVHIENHKNVCYFGIKKYDKLLEQEVSKIVNDQNFIYLNIAEMRIKALPVEFNAFFVFYHLFHHFIHLGVGVRQFCDWILLMSVYSQQIDKDGFIRLTESFDLLNAMKIFASVAIKYLGADPSVFPFKTDVNGKYVDLVMNDVLHGGNFGYEVFKKKSFRNELHRKWYSFNYSTSRIRKIAGIAPEHIKTLPFNKITTNIKLLLKNYFFER